MLSHQGRDQKNSDYLLLPKVFVKLRAFNKCGGVAYAGHVKSGAFGDAYCLPIGASVFVFVF